MLMLAKTVTTQGVKESQNSRRWGCGLCHISTVVWPLYNLNVRVFYHGKEVCPLDKRLTDNTEMTDISQRKGRDLYETY